MQEWTTSHKESLLSLCECKNNIKEIMGKYNMEDFYIVPKFYPEHNDIVLVYPTTLAIRERTKFKQELEQYLQEKGMDSKVTILSKDYIEEQRGFSNLFKKFYDKTADHKITSDELTEAKINSIFLTKMQEEQEETPEKRRRIDSPEQSSGSVSPESTSDDNMQVDKERITSLLQKSKTEKLDPTAMAELINGMEKLMAFKQAGEEILDSQTQQRIAKRAKEIQRSTNTQEPSHSTESPKGKAVHVDNPKGKGQ